MGTTPMCGQTNKVKLLPSRRTTYVGGNYSQLKAFDKPLRIITALASIGFLKYPKKDHLGSDHTEILAMAFLLAMRNLFSRHRCEIGRIPSNVRYRHR